MRNVDNLALQNSIRPGQVWLDTKGERIQAHGGSMFIEDGIFYWYGENKEKTTPGSGNWHWGVRAYSSTDLYNWEDLGLIIPPVLDDPDSPLHPAQKTDRPHIIFNESHRQVRLLDQGDGRGQPRHAALHRAHRRQPARPVRDRAPELRAARDERRRLRPRRGPGHEEGVLLLREGPHRPDLRRAHRRLHRRHRASTPATSRTPARRSPARRPRTSNATASTT